MAQRRPVVIIAGGGTGGHIYPGVAIARKLRELHAEMDVHFVGAEGGLEEKIVPREGFPLHTMPIGKLHKSVGWKTRLITLLKMPLAFVSAVRLLWMLRPRAVLGVGGFASGPMLFVAALFRVRSVIWEPNAYPGLANRLLSRFVDKCLLVFEEAGRHLSSRSIARAGLPVRPTMTPAKRPEGKRPLRVLIFGGSQGARAINRIVTETWQKTGWLEDIEVIHQTGAADFSRVREAYQGAPGRFQVFEYLHDMDERMKWADLVVCRSGASTVAEVCACEKAAIFIPLPTAADDHQRKNAEVLGGAGAAIVFAERDLTPEKFRDLLVRFRDDRSQIASLEERVRRFQFPHAAETIVAHLLNEA